MISPKKILAIFLSFSLTISYSQIETGKPEFLPPSPEASSLGKYGQHSVNLNTGTPNISIPLYTIQLKDFSFPVSISYNASGIKVNEIASRVGLGWALNAGGTISINTVGLSDAAVGVTVDTAFAPLWQSGNPNAHYNLALDILGGEIYNTEPDIYIYNFMGYTGKYVNTANGIINLPFNNDVVFDGNVATDKTGNKFYFGASETQSTHRSCIVEVATDPFVSTVTAYYLSMIVTAAGDSIVLNYSEDTYSYYLSTNEKRHFLDPNEAGGECPLPEFVYDRCRTKAYASIPRLASIIVSNGTAIYFDYGYERFDVETVSGSTHMLTRMSVVNTSVINVDTLHYQFEYETINQPESGTDEYIANNARTFLKQLTMSDNGVYKFSYHHPEFLPPRDSYDVDYWGYYNSAGNSTLLPSFSPFEFSGANRMPNETYSGYGTLNKLIYPTGGYSVFEFEGHKSSTGSLYFSGGLRVKSITDYAADNSVAEKKKYLYPNIATGFTGDPFVAPYFISSYITRKVVEGILTQNHCQFYLLFNTSTPVIGGYDFNTAVKYGEVIVQHENVEKSGKSRYLFSNIPFQGNGIITFPEGQDEVKPSAEEHYQYTPEGFKLISKKRYTYKVYNDLAALWKRVDTVNNYNQMLGFRLKQVLPEQSSFPAEFDWFYYRYASIWYHLDSLIETTYNGSDSLIAYQLYKYENPDHAQVTKTTTYNSLGDTLVRVMRYPQDYDEAIITGLTSDYYNAFRGLPVEALDYKNNFLVSAVKNDWEVEDNILRLSEKSVTRLSTPLENEDDPTYHTLYKIVAEDENGNPTQIDYQNNLIQSLLWDGKSHKLQAIVENAADSDIAFSNFDTDSKGNWTYTNSYESGSNNIYSGLRSFDGESLEKGGLNPDKKYKVSVRAKSNEPTIDNETATVTPGREDWNLYEWIVDGVPTITINANGALLDDARLHPINSQMVSFSHHPLLGVMCKTDTNNVTQYFEYDGSGRLVVIRDDNDHILKTFTYKYVQDGQ